MRWNAGRNSGFTTGAPWLPLGDDVMQVNVEAERDDPTSILSLYRALIELRQSDPALTLGAAARIEAHGPVLTYLREGAGRRLLVALNLTPSQASVPSGPGRVLLSTHLDRQGPEGDVLDLRADEGVIVDFTNA
jgi:alpha-glucosidase